MRSYLKAAGVQTHVQSRADSGARAVRLAAEGGRVRLLGPSPAELATAVSGSPAVAVYAGEAVSARRVELLTFLRKQAASITTLRFGLPRSYPIVPDHQPHAGAA